MTLEDQYKLLVECYHGILLMNEYDLKEYALKRVEELIKNFESNYINVPFEEIKEHVKKNVSDKTKLQSALIVLNSINYDMELILLIKEKIKKTCK